MKKENVQRKERKSGIFYRKPLTVGTKGKKRKKISADRWFPRRFLYTISS